MIVIVDDRLGPFIGIAIKHLARQLERDGETAPREVMELARVLLSEPAEPDLLDSAQAATVLHISPRTLRRRVADGTVPARRVGRRVLFDANDIRRLGRGA